RGSGEGLGILRLRSCSASRSTILAQDDRVGSVRSLGGWRVAALIGAVCIFLSAAASATTYYVSSSLGNDGNAGTSPSAAWQTVAKVNAATLAAGDSVLFLRGDAWNESLVPPASGASGNPITFDAYGTGAPPNLTGYYAIPASAWTLVTGNAWKA